MGVLAGYPLRDVRRGMQHGQPQMTVAHLLGNTPTRTQSALLTVMGDNYAEIHDQVYECPESAWFLTANDDQGGGTYQVIEALRDRIDVIVQALAFNPRFLDDLLTRVEENRRPEEAVPREIVFTAEQIARLTSA
jgi:MoxR-like ATPase